VGDQNRHGLNDQLRWLGRRTATACHSIFVCRSKFKHEHPIASQQTRMNIQESQIWEFATNDDLQSVYNLTPVATLPPNALRSHIYPAASLTLFAPSGASSMNCGTSSTMKLGVPCASPYDSKPTSSPNASSSASNSASSTSSGRS
jgi:hypothetical protein